MKRIVVYRYYHKFENNKQFVRFIKYLNPGIRVYGIYGGPEDQFQEASEVLNEVFEHNYLIKDKETTWKWKNGDMTYQLWYNDFGHTLDFDIMHSIEWDLLYFDSLDSLFAHVPMNTLALTGLIPLRKIQHEWYWTKKEPARSDWKNMMQYFKSTFQYDQQPFGMLGPGTSLPRIFLEKIKNTEIPELALDELRIPMFAQVFKVPMADTMFYKKWFSRREWKCFNSNAVDVELKTIHHQLQKSGGRRVFHPFRGDLSFEGLVTLHKLTKEKHHLANVFLNFGKTVRMV